MVRLKTKEEIALMREGGKILAQILEEIIKKVEPGTSTEALEKQACDLIKEAGGTPSFKNYKMYNGAVFPSALCISVNDEIVHAPSLPDRILNNGDIVGIDLGMEYPVYRKEQTKFQSRTNRIPFNKYSESGGYYTDMSKTIGVGEITREAKKLINITKECLDLAIKTVKPERTLSDIGKAIQEHAEKNGFSVVRELVGHGVGHEVHEDPQVPNYEIRDDMIENVILEPGMVIAIEPMVNIGDFRIKQAPDGLSIATADSSLSAHFEHTVAVTDGGCEVLTRL